MTAKSVAICVVAGDYQEFRAWCQEQRLSWSNPEVVYVRSQADLVGRRNIYVVHTGTWARRRDLVSISETLAILTVSGCLLTERPDVE